MRLWLLRNTPTWGPDEAEWVLNAFPQKFKAVAPAALRVIPRKIIPTLLDEAVLLSTERFITGLANPARQRNA